MRQWTIDAFADRPFRGNPACVVEPFAAWPKDAWMQALAQENNQAETAFLLRTADPSRFGLRWFTPATEVPLCGHATLASAHALFVEIGGGGGLIAFDTLSGVLTVEQAEHGYRMDFPASPPKWIETPPELAAALGAAPVEVWASKFLVAMFETESAVRGLQPDFVALARVKGEGYAAGCVIVAAPGQSEFDVVSRFFAPAIGVPEDPTTGAAHCVLAPLFADRLGRNPLRCHQAYPGRGGDMICEVRGDRVLLTGQAVTVVESRLRL